MGGTTALVAKGSVEVPALTTDIAKSGKFRIDGFGVRVFFSKLSLWVGVSVTYTFQGLL